MFKIIKKIKTKIMWTNKKIAMKVAIKKARKKYNTRARKIKKVKWTILLTVSMMSAVILWNYPEFIFNEISLNLSENSHNSSIVCQKSIENSPEAQILTKKGTLREVTAYNAGIEAQTDASPCISASGDNICEMLARGEKICATNFVPLGTKLYIKNYGECTVLDRMNSRFKNRVDIAMEAHEYQRAVKFGLQTLEVSVIN
jgi:3D (Asp-Asp-Asp) domain-containing protein